MAPSTFKPSPSRPGKFCACAHRCSFRSPPGKSPTVDFSRFCQSPLCQGRVTPPKRNPICTKSGRFQYFRTQNRLPPNLFLHRNICAPHSCLSMVGGFMKEGPGPLASDARCIQSAGVPQTHWKGTTEGVSAAESSHLPGDFGLTLPGPAPGGLPNHSEVVGGNLGYLEAIHPLQVPSRTPWHARCASSLGTAPQRT